LKTYETLGYFDCVHSVPFWLQCGSAIRRHDSAALKPSQPASIADLSRSDEQGAVKVDITPVNLDHPGQTIDFEVSMNTHSVDLSMDLASLATLTTDTGSTVQAMTWAGPGGGHHVSGKLSFPATVNGKPVLQNAAELTLTLRNVDVPERTFKWQLAK
jgi:hypothetical protein